MRAYGNISFSPFETQKLFLHSVNREIQPAFQLGLCAFFCPSTGDLGVLEFFFQCIENPCNPLYWTWKAQKCQLEASGMMSSIDSTCPLLWSVTLPHHTACPRSATPHCLHVCTNACLFGVCDNVCAGVCLYVSLDQISDRVLIQEIHLSVGVFPLRH